MDLTFLKTGGIKIACIDVENGFFNATAAMLLDMRVQSGFSRTEDRTSRKEKFVGWWPPGLRGICPGMSVVRPRPVNIKSCATGRFQGGVNNDKITLCDILLLVFNGIEIDDPRLVSGQQLVSGRGDNQ